jgi:quinol monooxygenase YgiN
MISAICLATVKPERMGEWLVFLRWLGDTTRTEDEGCLRYEWYGPVQIPGDGPVTNPYAYLLHEEWRDEEALTKHVARLEREFGPPDPGGALPARLLAYCDRFEAIVHNVEASYVMVGGSESEVPS